MFKVKKRDGLSAKDIMVATTVIYNNELDENTIVVKKFFLVYKTNEEYREIFSDVRFEEEKNTHLESGITCRFFDTPYIVKLQPLTDYLDNPKGNQSMESGMLFEFILKLNVLQQIGAFDVKEDEKE